MFTIAAFGPDDLKHDENANIGLTKMAIDQDLVSALQSPKNPSAAGPLCPMLHIIAEPPTALQPGSMRVFQFTTFLGRQTYLVTFPALAIAVFFRPKEWKLLGTISVAALMTCSWLFVVDGGLVPSSQGLTNQGISTFHGLLGLSYLGIASSIMNPGQLKVLTLRYTIFLTAISSLVATISTSTAAIQAQTMLVEKKAWS